MDFLAQNQSLVPLRSYPVHPSSALIRFPLNTKKLRDIP